MRLTKSAARSAAVSFESRYAGVDSWANEFKTSAVRKQRTVVTGRNWRARMNHPSKCGVTAWKIDFPWMITKSPARSIARTECEVRRIPDRYSPRSGTLSFLIFLVMEDRAARHRDWGRGGDIGGQTYPAWLERSSTGTEPYEVSGKSIHDDSLRLLRQSVK